MFKPPTHFSPGVVLLLSLSAIASCSSGDPQETEGGADSGAIDNDGAPADATAPVTQWETRTIHFDDLDDTDWDVTDQYAPDVIFSSESPCACQASSSAGVAESQPNYLLTYFACDEGWQAPVYLQFGAPVRNLSFSAVGINTDGKFATLRIIQGEDVQTLDLIGLGSPYAPVHVDLSELGDAITRLEFVDVDDFVGIGFDDFVFQVPVQN